MRYKMIYITNIIYGEISPNVVYLMGRSYVYIQLEWEYHGSMSNHQK